MASVRPLFLAEVAFDRRRLVQAGFVVIAETLLASRLIDHLGYHADVEIFQRLDGWHSGDRLFIGRNVTVNLREEFAEALDGYAPFVGIGNKSVPPLTVN